MFLSTSKDLINWTVIDKQNIDVVNGHERNAGNIVIYQDSLYRLSQINTPLYGSGIRINKILNITTNAYREEFVKEIKLNSDLNNVNGFHTLNFIGDQCFLITESKTFDTIFAIIL